MPSFCSFVDAKSISSSPSNVLRFSCRQGALHKMTSKKPRSRAPKAANCKRVLGASCDIVPLGIPAIVFGSD